MDKNITPMLSLSSIGYFISYLISEVLLYENFYKQIILLQYKRLSIYKKLMSVYPR